MLKTIAIVLIALIGGLLAYAATRPDTFRVERAIVINAKPEAVFPHINQLRRWEAWSPWEKVDPQLQRTYSGPEEGVGATYAWQGNKDIGSGSMVITESNPSSKLLLQIDFIEPFAARNSVEFNLSPEGEGTRVTQAMYGPSPFISKVMGIFFSMDKMVGDKYEEGLANLKQVAEKP